MGVQKFSTCTWIISNGITSF